MSNGFVSSSPGSRHGASLSTYKADYATAQRFTCPGSGTQEITEAGIWAWRWGSNRTLKIAIFTNDSGNTCPESMVTNSEISITVTSASPTMAKAYSSYGTKPTVTGGTVYWLGFLSDCDATNYFGLDYLNQPSGTITALYRTETYPTWPTASAWETHTDMTTVDMGIYVVYQQAATLPPFDYYYNNMRP